MRRRGKSRARKQYERQLSQKNLRQAKRRSRGEKKEHIMKLLTIYSQPRHYSATEIAYSSGYAPSTKFKELLDEMVDDGLLRMTGMNYHGGVHGGIVHKYALPEVYDAYHNEQGECMF